MASELNAQGIARVAELIGGRRVAMLTTFATDGGLASRPMAMPDRAFDGTLWFLASADTDHVADVTQNPLVNVTFSHGAGLSLNGRAHIADDADLKHQIWDDIMEQWFGCGPDDPRVVLIAVEVLAAEYWVSPGRPSIRIPVREPARGRRPAGGQGRTA